MPTSFDLPPRGAVTSLRARNPTVPPERLVAEMVPPPRFDVVRFATYDPDSGHPSQREAVTALESFAVGLAAAQAGVGRRRLHRRSPDRRSRASGGPAGVYLDGGFGVGKTHLLASLWHAAPGPKAFGTFVELTHLVGALGFASTVTALSGHRLLCIDEFELDDPGDTVLVSTLLSRLVTVGVKLAATSNTLPGKLGEGRFAAQDFLREIQTLSRYFQVVRVDGADYRHRGLPDAAVPRSDEEIESLAARTPGATLDGFDDLAAHLARVHPSRYGAMLDGVAAVFLRGVRQVTDQATALRLVVLADRLYDREIPVVASGTAFDAVFSEDMLRGGYRKKYLRAVSRLIALTRDGNGLT